MARKAYEYALELLSARGYTIRNLRRKLVSKEYEAEEIEGVIERLIECGLLDDARYAREYARQKLTSGGSSVRRVRQQLLVRGVSSEHARAATDAVMREESVDIERSINATVRRKLASIGDLPRDVKRRRIFALLARRGFEIADIRRAVDGVS